MKKYFIVDYSGTLIKADVAEQANTYRYEELGMSLPDVAEHKEMHATKSHYGNLKERIEEVYGITDTLSFEFRDAQGNLSSMSGKDMKTSIMTDRFRTAMFRVAQERKLDLYREGMLDTLKAIQDRGYTIAIVSGIRQDIITGMLAISGLGDHCFEVYGQDPALLQDSKTVVHNLAKENEVCYCIGDKLSDVELIEGIDDAKSMYFPGGHPTGGEEETADYVISDAKELLEIIK